MLRGVFAPVVTVFSADGIDEAATRRHIRRIVASGIQGLAPGGTASEFIALSFEERQRMLAVALEEGAGRVPIIAGTGCYSTRDTIRLSRWAQSAGASGVMVIVPFFMHPSEREVMDHFRRVREAIDLPIMVYQNELSGVKLSLDSLADLAEEGVLSAAKISQRDPSLMRDLKLRVGDRCAVFVGLDVCAFEALCDGVDGWISAAPMIFPRLTVHIFNLVKEAKLEEARRLWLQLSDFIRLEFGPGPRGLGNLHILAVQKAALQALGDPVGEPLPPMQPLSDKARAYVQDVVANVARLENSLML